MPFYTKENSGRDAGFEVAEKQKIPRVIFQTFKGNELPHALCIAAANVINWNPEYEYVYFNDEDARKVSYKGD